MLAGYMTLLHTAKSRYLLTILQILSIEIALTNKKEAVTSAKRKYVLDLQVSKYGLLAALWQEEPVKKQ